MPEQVHAAGRKDGWRRPQRESRALRGPKVVQVLRLGGSLVAGEEANRRAIIKDHTHTRASLEDHG
jgi:hypothetical protein